MILSEIGLIMLAGIWLFANCCAPGAVGVARERVVDALQRAVRVERLAEVAGAQRGVRHAEEGEEALRPLVAFERPEEEHLVLLDRTADRGAVVVRLDRQLVGHRSGAEVERLGVQLVAVEALERRTPERVRARLGDDRHRRAARHPCSASKLLVDTFTVSTVSAGEMYMLWFGSQMFMFVAPSVRVEFCVFACPLTLVAIDRPGVSVSALPNDIGVVPGTRLISAW